jgi:hypothetical protein
MPQTVTAEVVTDITSDVIDRGGDRRQGSGQQLPAQQPPIEENLMTTTPAALADQYFAFWNETAADRRSELAETVWSADGLFLDPSFEVTGRDDLSKLVATAQQMFAGLSFTQVGEIDAHHNRLRWTWHLGAEGQDPVAGGTDIVTLDADGKIQEVNGFHDFAPAH